MSEWIYVEIRFTDDNSWLTYDEILDVETSWREIERGQAKRFNDVDDFLADLKEESTVEEIHEGSAT